MFLFYIVQSQQAVFFSKNWFRFQGSTRETSFATVFLLVEESFMRNVSKISVQLMGDCNDGDSIFSYHRGCYNFQQLILSGVMIEYNGQLTHRASHGPINVYNSSTTTLPNSGMCSNETHRYHSFSVKIYFANITGSFWVSLLANFLFHHSLFSRLAVTVYSDVLIHNGKILY